MPSKRMYRRRRPSKPSVAKAKKIVGKIHKSAAKKNKDTLFVRCRVVADTTPSQGATVANYLSSFWKLLDPSSAVGLTQTSEFNLWKNIYDRVRVNRIRVKWIPKANMNTMYDNIDQALKNNKGDGRIHTVVLRDDEGFTNNIPRLSRVSSYKSYDVKKSWTRSFGIKYATDVWLDAQNIYSDTTLLERIGAYGGIGMYGENYMEESGTIFNVPLGSVEITYDVVFQGKIFGGVSFAQNGDVVLSAPVAGQYTPSPYTVVSGTIADSRYDMYNQVVPHTDADAP